MVSSFSISARFTAKFELVFALMIVTGKNCAFAQFSTRIAAWLLFHMFAQSIKFCTFYYHVLKSADI